MYTIKLLGNVQTEIFYWYILLAVICNQTAAAAYVRTECAYCYPAIYSSPSYLYTPSIEGCMAECDASAACVAFLDETESTLCQFFEECGISIKDCAAAGPSDVYTKEEGAPEASTPELIALEPIIAIGESECVAECVIDKTTSCAEIEYNADTSLCRIWRMALDSEINQSQYQETKCVKSSGDEHKWICNGD